ncbi:alpha/beta hydrolase [Marivibrio halodurans]|uniref:Alpha/beta hydrolase n=1 Tax=Marivibrio halodurans TaxID=2039722 RepID=A0A8J7S5E1_9PROT|nr:alpha/beta hydrolase [Marivibrio halodurans]MBP5855892.1 alpha/beta hydrolase [Marivibrio halodurans]
MFDGFEDTRIDTGTVTLHVRHGGEGPPLLLLHGYPQTGAMWAPIANDLAKRFHVVVPDLRGYGRSDKPASDPRHVSYSKRAMAGDLARLMTALGHDTFQAAGHDRGGRVLHRLCRDYPERVSRAAVLDIVPTATVFETTDKTLATAYYHWFFLIQPAPFPETLIGGDPLYFLHHTLGAWGTGLSAYDPAALADYERAFADPETIRASCEDYRAAATIDLEHDAADAERRIECPLLVLWGANGLMARIYDVLGTWQSKAKQVRGHPIPGGHFLVEESPEATLEAFDTFFSS